MFGFQFGTLARGEIKTCASCGVFCSLASSSSSDSTDEEMCAACIRAAHAFDEAQASASMSKEAVATAAAADVDGERQKFKTLSMSAKLPSSAVASSKEDHHRWNQTIAVDVKDVRKPWESEGGGFARIRQLQRDALIFDVNDHSTIIGTGAFATVVKGELQTKGKKLLVAIKCFTDSVVSRRELELVSTLAHPNIVHTFGVCVPSEDGEKLPALIVMELMNESLQQFLRRVNRDQPGKSLPHDLFFSLALDIANGLQYLHSENIIHRDVKSANVLLDEEYVARLCDFGIAKDDDERNGTLLKGSYSYMAPEMIQLDDNTTSRTFKLDVFGYAVVLYELLTKKPPWASEKSELAVVSKVVRGLRMPKPAEVSSNESYEKIWSLIERCWAQEAEKRPSIDNAIEELMQLEQETFWSSILTSKGTFKLSAVSKIRSVMTDEDGGTGSIDAKTIQAAVDSPAAAAALARVLATALKRRVPSTIDKEKEAEKAKESHQQLFSNVLEDVEREGQAVLRNKVEEVSAERKNAEGDDEFHALREAFARMPLQFNSNAANGDEDNDKEEEDDDEWRTIDLKQTAYIRQMLMEAREFANNSKK